MREDTGEVLTGLSEEEARRRHSEFGPNSVNPPSRLTPLKLLARQFSDPIVLGLCAASILAGGLGEWTDTIAIVAVILLSGGLGFFQEYRTGRALDALEKMAPSWARVRRSGRVRQVASRELVVGDVLVLEAGDRVPADVRLHEVHGLQINEAALTGESVAAIKMSGHTLPIGGDVREATAYKGTFVLTGRAVGVVSAIGAETQLGHIAELVLNQSDVETPLQRRLARLAKHIALLALGLCTVVFALGLYRGEATLVVFMTALSLAVAAIPEALPAVVTVALAAGARRMAGRNALVRRLRAVETLGSVTCICTDKTGTLTENRMKVERLYVRTAEVDANEINMDRMEPQTTDLQDPHRTDLQDSDRETYDQLSRLMVLNNDAYLTPQGHIEGEPTEVALLTWALRFGVDASQVRADYTRTTEFGFSAELRRMGTLHMAQNVKLFIVKGAPEVVIPLCGREMSQLELEKSLDVAESMAERGLRVMAFAMREVDGPSHSERQEDLEKNLKFVGLVGLADPAREGVQEALDQCQTAGVRVIMVTGDHPNTAFAIASQLGITPPNAERSTVMTGAEMRSMSDEALAHRIQGVSVFARVDPTDKFRIVSALQALGEVVAVTGDGVNDAPALRRAEVGVAMGRAGTDVAREASDVILLDDNFATIVHAIREGRTIYDNIRKFLRFSLTGNSAEIWTILIAPLLGFPLPLVPIQILWINLITDGLPGVALSVETDEKDVMIRPPRSTNEDLLGRGLWQHAFVIGLFMAGTCLWTQFWTADWGKGLYWQTMTFMVLSMTQMGHLLSIRSESHTVLKRTAWNSPIVIGTAVFTIGLQVAAAHVSWLGKFLKLQPLGWKEWAWVAAFSLMGFVIPELDKLSRARIERKRSRKAQPLAA